GILELAVRHVLPPLVDAKRVAQPQPTRSLPNDYRGLSSPEVLPDTGATDLSRSAFSFWRSETACFAASVASARFSSTRINSPVSSSEGFGVSHTSASVRSSCCSASRRRGRNGSVGEGEPAFVSTETLLRGSCGDALAHRSASASSGSDSQSGGTGASRRFCCADSNTSHPSRNASGTACSRD